MFGFFTFGFDFVAEHLEAVETGFVDLARLAVGAEVPVTRGQLGDTPIQPGITLTRQLLIVFDKFLQVQNAQLQNAYQVLGLQA